MTCALALVACDRPEPAPQGRSEAVTARPSATAAASATATAKPRRALCTAKPAGKPPDAKIDTVAAPGVEPPPKTIPFGAGKWIWVNLWAAWCGPCKEEMPRLLRWQKQLRKAGVLVDLAFVSLDDDDRQLTRFLAAQPEDGVRASYWLPESERGPWLGALGIAPNAVLPVHALISPRNELACVIDGALDDADYPRIAAVLGG